MLRKYRVHCDRHNYDTRMTLDSKDTAISAARMHAQIPCQRVEVTDSTGQTIDWKKKESA